MRIPREDGYPYAIVSGAQADQTIKGSPGTVRRVKVWAIGDATSKVEVYDGTVAAGTKIDDIVGTAVNPADPPLDVYCKSSIHVKTTNPNTAMRVTITFD